MVLSTIGYEGLSVETFFGELVRNGIETIVDIRELPISHKAGFSKTAIANEAAARGISYVHLPALGCPKEIRHAYREDKNWALYTRKFLDYLLSQTDAITGLVERVQREHCCLLCFEADYFHCHRRYVAEEVQGILGDHLSVRHLAPGGKAAAPWLNASVGIPLQ